MNFFKSVFSDDPEEEQSDSQTSPTLSPKSQPNHNPNPNPNPNPDPDVSTVTNAWSFGSTLFKTLASKSESVIDTYRRDLEEFSSGLKYETAVIRQAATKAVKDLPGSLEAGAAAAQESLESVGQVIDNLTDIIAHGKDSILANDSDSESSASDSKQITSNLNLSSKPYSRLDAQIRGIQCDLNTYCKEVEDVEEFDEWKLGFVLDERVEEIEDLIEENGVIEEIYNEIVPNKIDEETFWARLFFRMYKVKKAEEARSKLVNRAISGEEEDLSWDVDDDDSEDRALKQNDEVKILVEKSDVEAEGKEELKGGNDDQGGVSESKSDGGVDPVVSSEEPGDKQVVRSDEKITSEGKTDSDISIISSQLSPEEEDLGWDEIEDVGSVDEHKLSSADGSPNKVDLRKRLSAAVDEEEDLTWDIEDDDEPVKS